jgi:hypothetical protein
MPNLPPLYDKNKTPVKVVSQYAEIVDPTLLQAKKDYPSHSINGEYFVQVVRDPLTGRGERIPDESFVVPVPHRQPSLLDSGTARQMQQPPNMWTVPPPPSMQSPDPAAAAPQPPHQVPGAGRLRALGE